jgi:hypothetical protein
LGLLVGLEDSSIRKRSQVLGSTVDEELISWLEGIATRGYNAGARKQGKEESKEESHYRRQQGRQNKIDF